MGRNNSTESEHMVTNALLAAAGHLDQGTGDAAFCRGKIAPAHFYAGCVLPPALSHAENVKAGDTALAGVSDALA